MTPTGDDVVAAFYDEHPYPPPIASGDAGAFARRSAAVDARVEHHRTWPRRAPESVGTVLVAGCGTSQAVRHALQRPAAQVVAIDVSRTAIDRSRQLADRVGVDNLELVLLPIERVGELERTFDHVVCTGVLHHLADPAAGLASLAAVIAPGGAITVMVYARHGRVGVYLLQDYCRRLGIEPTAAEIDDLVATLREIPLGHPLSRLLRETRDFHDHDALADALLHPRDQAYDVPEVFDLLDGAGLRFGRWHHQAPYLPDCGAISETPHAGRIAALPPHEQHAAIELFRGTLTRHTAIAFTADDDVAEAALDFSLPDASAWVPIRVPSAAAVSDRLPPGVASALLNRAHPCTDLVRFVDAADLARFESIDGERTIGELGPTGPGFVERLWRDDLVVIDATPRGGTPR